MTDYRCRCGVTFPTANQLRGHQSCKNHYPNWIERFADSHVVDPATGCWVWTGNHTPKGYGSFRINGLTQQAHRIAYEMYVGPISEGMQIDHLCRNRGCQNPEHMEPVTPRENTLRGETIGARNAAKTHCPQGHPYDVANTRIYRGSRCCHACSLARSSGKQVNA